MRSHFLKIRMNSDVYQRLKVRAAEAGKAISTFANAILEEENSISNTSIQLKEIQSHLQELAGIVGVLSLKKNEEVINPLLKEILLILREIALESNAQILNRVSLKIQNNQ